MKSVMSENQNSQSQVHATASRYLRFKPGKRGLNSPFTCPAGRGGSSQTLPNHVTGNGRSTRHSQRVITLGPGALLEISFLFLNSSTPLKSIHYFCDWGRQYSQVQFPGIHLLWVTAHNLILRYGPVTSEPCLLSLQNQKTPASKLRPSETKTCTSKNITIQNKPNHKIL
jgi:hypothetical protein